MKNLLEMIAKLTAEEREQLKMFLLSSEFKKAVKLDEYVANERFANGRACPLCGSVHVVRNGHHSNGAQRFYCRDCNKSFVTTTNTIVASTKKDFSVWEKYISCMMHGMSLRKTAEYCGINKNTAFYWRHKILDALQHMANSVELNGIVEVDETFFNVSYKGSREMPRQARHRGSENHTRGLSHEKVCVPCAVNRTGLSIAKASNLGRLSTQDVHNIYDGRIEANSTLVTDKLSAYVRFASASNLNLVQLKNGRAKSGIYNIQHINNYHSRLKKFMGNFNGVATKYLNNYLVWNNFVNYAKETHAEKKNILMRFALTTTMNMTCEQVSQREALPFCA